MNIIEELEKYRLENRITQEQLAEKLEVSFATVNRWFNGRTKPNKIQEYQIKKLLWNTSITEKTFEVNTEKNSYVTGNMPVKFAEYLSETISKKTISGMLEKAEKGIYPSKPPFGYTNNVLTKTIDFDNVKAPKIKEVFENLAKGKTAYEDLDDIATNLGISKNTLYRTIRNPFYYGDFIFNEKIYHGKHTPLISKETWDKANHKLKEVLK